MQKLLYTFLVVVLFSSVVGAQNISYTVLENDPSKAYTKFVAPEWGAEMSSSNLSILVGANTRMGISDKLTFEGAAQVDLIQVNGSGLGFRLEGGIFFPLKTKTKVKEVPVILSYDPYAGTTSQNGQSYNVEVTKFLSIPDMDYKDQYGVRGGIYTRNLGVESDGIKAPAASSSLFLAGPYVGFQKASQAYVKAKINNDVERIGAGFGRYYADLLILPVRSLGDAAIAPALKKDRPLGWRAGVQWYLDPHDGEYKRLGRTIITAEIGSRAYTGFYLNMTWGFALLNKR